MNHGLRQDSADHTGQLPRRVHRALMISVLALSCAMGTPAARASGVDIPALMAAGQWSQARGAVEQQLQARPKDAQLQLYKGVIQRETGQLREALATFTQLSVEHPNLPEAWNNLAAVHAALGQFEQARVALEKALHTHPSYAAAYDNLGAVYARLASLAYSRALLIDAEGAVPNAKPSPQQQAANEALKQSLQQPMQLALLREVRELPAASAPLPAATPVTAPPVVVASAPPPAPPQAAPAASTATQAPTSSAAPSSPTPSAPTIAPNPVTQAPVLRPAPVAPRETQPAPAPTAPPAPPPLPSTAASASSAEEAAVAQAVRAWAQAWSDRDMTRYLAAYASNFDTGSQSRPVWEQSRRDRIVSKRRISVEVQSLQITVNGSRATAKFLQDYKADTLAVVNGKTLELTRTADRWLIVKESAGN
ncbi:tetratricopeptide repeat protein [Hylemonella sp. W303a]|uniref:L,D-transpeptidase Cds6 family protein n=1 Tax=Hylemonella sp. W303a TaxID=3389873 RepID=UPI00396AFA18